MWQQQQSVSNEEFVTKSANCCACGSKSKLAHCILYALTILVLIATSTLHLLSSKFGRDNVLQPLTNCLLAKNGEDYAGYQTATRTGLSCQEWVKQEPHKHEYVGEDTLFRDGSPEAAKNYCRNPRSAHAGVRDRPWCFTTTAKRWEYCSESKNECGVDVIFHKASDVLFKNKSTLFYPEPWVVVAVWTMTYVWLLLGVVFTFSIACCRSSEAWTEFKHGHPDILPWQLVSCLALVLALLTAWMFLWDREYEQVSFAMILFAAFASFVVVLCKAWQYRKTKDESIEDRSLKQYVPYHSFLENGLVAFVTTLTFFSMIHMTIILDLKEVVEEEIGAVIALSILLNFYILWIIFDLIVMANAMRFVFSPQLILSICLIGVMVRSWTDHSSAAMIFAAAFVVIIVVTTVAKVVTTAIQCRRMSKERKQMESLATSSSVYETASRSFDSYETAKTINKLLYGSAREYEESYRQNDVLY